MPKVMLDFLFRDISSISVLYLYCTSSTLLDNCKGLRFLTTENNRI
jgi:hypothetical protein